MLVLNNITFEFGGEALYRDASWHIKPAEKIGLIGPNGSGKSTLLRLITGEYSLTAGEITRRRNLNIAFLNQDLLSYQSTDPIIDVAMEAFARQNELSKQLDKLLVQAELDHSEEMMHKLADVQHEFEALDGYNLKHKAEKVLEGLGFSTTDLLRPLVEFSGGYRMRVMLAKMLLEQPDLLLLDEPTNHLDLPSIQWLEQYLIDYPRTIVLVSHDRFFIDKVVNKIVEIDNEQLNIYTGNYTDYMEEKAERIELQKNQFKNQQAYIKQQEKFIERFRAKNTKAKAVQSRIKKLDKLERIDDVEENNEVIKVSFSFSVQPGKEIAEIKIKEKSFPGIEIFKNTGALISRGDKIALIGANGRGKSTLLRIIDSSEKFSGEVKLGYNVTKTFFAQHQMESLNLDHEVLQELQHYAPDINDTTLRTLLGTFLFKGDDVFKKVRVLSGGEKSRVALAKVMLSKANFLLLDEPTNHLDIKSVNTLIQVLRNTESTFVVVSHDRFFLSEVANKIWYIENQELKEYPGTYEEYELWMEGRKYKPVEKKPEKKEIKVKQENQDAEQSKELKKIHRKLSNDCESLDEEIKKIKKKQQEITVLLAAEADFGKLEKLGNEYQKMEKELAEKTKSWEDLYMQLSELEQENNN
ncbi:MAG: ribosomal protection-like ABC-F family protein [Bacteroidia bacterium]